MQVVTETNITEYPLVSRGKVRDIYEISPEVLLIVTTDRMSAFDVIMSEPVPFKGVVLNQITLFWMQKFASIIPNHIIEHDVNRFPAALQKYKEQLEGRSVLVHKAKPLAIECVVRGYLTGSGLIDYNQTGALCGYALPAGMVEAEKLETPLFTPSTKADLGEHDVNISCDEAKKIVGDAIFDQVEKATLTIFSEARAYAEKLGIIIADTKFEFGMVNGKLYIIDEVLTPDSSRFWPSKGYEKGKVQPSFDKQYLRNWLAGQPWDKTPPPPALPQEVIQVTCQKYCEAYSILTGKTLDLPL